MAHIPINFGGGSGSGSDDCTAGREHVLQNYTAITSESDDEPAGGTMPDKTGWSYSNLEAGKFVLVPKGYHDGTDKVTAKDLASQTSANAVAGHIKSGETAWVNGNKITGSMSVSSVLSFSVAAYSKTQLTFSWKNPAQAAGKPFSGVIICCKAGGYPTSPTDGMVYMGSGSTTAANTISSVTIGGFTENTTYYSRIWAYCVCSAGGHTVNGTRVLVSGSYREASAKTSASGSRTFTGGSAFVIPGGIRVIDIFCVGGGGGGGGCNYSGGGGGGGGYTVTKKSVQVTPGEQLNVVIGAGGAASETTDGGTGGTTAVYRNATALCSANGGGGGNRKQTGGNGGSGGGCKAGSGGSNGGNGTHTQYSTYYTPGNGQGATTTAFGSNTGTVYSGGGAGAGSITYQHEDDGSAHIGQDNRYGSGGNYGGGNGAVVVSDVASGFHHYYSVFRHAVAGTSGSGGGGGGGYGLYNDKGNFIGQPATGGTGICIIRW